MNYDVGELLLELEAKLNWIIRPRTIITRLHHPKLKNIPSHLLTIMSHVLTIMSHDDVMYDFLPVCKIR